MGPVYDDDSCDDDDWTPICWTCKRFNGGFKQHCICPKTEEKHISDKEYLEKKIQQQEMKIKSEIVLLESLKAMRGMIK